MTAEELNKLTPEEKRILIGDRCGREEPAWESPDASSGIKHSDLLPDYLNDLNAMHEAEKVMTVEQKQAYRELLADCLDDVVDWGLVHASAAQRAEAFLLTL